VSNIIRKRILLLTQWFQPEPTLKGLLLARALVARGFDVEVVTGFPNYPGGKIYKGYKLRLVQKEVVDGVFVTRVPLFPSHSQNKLGRATNYLSFALSSLVYCLFFAKRPDVIHAYHPPITVGVSALFLRFFRRVPILLDIQDIWPDTLKATGMVSSPLWLCLVSKICNWVYRHSSKIIVLSPGFKKLLLERGVNKNKIDIIYNWADEPNLIKASYKPVKFLKKTEGFKILYAGNVGPAQQLTVILEAALLLSDKFPEITFSILGQGLELENLKLKAQRLGIENVYFIPAVSTNKVANYLTAADVLFVHLAANTLFHATIPGKTQAFMAIGKPIIMGVTGDAANLVMQAKCGLCIKPQDPDSLAQAAKYLYQMPKKDLLILGNNARQYYNKNLSLEIGVAKWSKTYNLILDEKN
jgi:colanic acid biosynthesis glycosyl transferase WcaI